MCLDPRPRVLGERVKEGHCSESIRDPQRPTEECDPSRLAVSGRRREVVLLDEGGDEGGDLDASFAHKAFLLFVRGEAGDLALREWGRSWIVATTDGYNPESCGGGSLEYFIVYI